MKRVLVVVSDEIARKALCEMVEACGYKPLDAVGGRAAFRQASMMRPHLILVALPLGDMTLSELLDKLTSVERTATIPVLAMGDVSEVGEETRLAGTVQGQPEQDVLKVVLDKILKSQKET